MMNTCTEDRARCSLERSFRVLVLSHADVVDGDSILAAYVNAPFIFQLKLCQVFWRFLTRKFYINLSWLKVFHTSAGVLKLLLIAGDVTMEEGKMVESLGATNFTGASSDKDVHEESSKEFSHVETSNLTLKELGVAPSSTLLEHRSRDSAIPLRGDSSDLKDGDAPQENLFTEGESLSAKDFSAHCELENPASAITSLPGEIGAEGAQQGLAAEFSEIVQSSKLGVKQELELDSTWVSESLENGKHLDVRDQPKREMHTEGGNLNAILETLLLGVWEKLISLDPNEIFKDPVDDSFAPNYSKIIKMPMCFSMMRAKITDRQYTSWRLFVEDFERICYNAMKYNQKRSKVSNAASTLLRQGKKILEPYIDHEDDSVDARKLVDDTVCTQELTSGKLAEAFGEGAACGPEEKRSSTTAHIEVIEVPVDELRTSHGRQDGISPLLGGKKDALGTVADLRNTLLKQDFEKSEGVRRDSKNSRMNHVEEEVKVEILDCTTGPEDLRRDFKDEATECSSSFGYTQSEEQSDPDGDEVQQNPEVESQLRDGNGALTSAFAEEDEMGGGNERSKKALNAEWKKYRRGIEWRCRWLEVRLNELRARSEKYDRILQERKAKNPWTGADVLPGEETSARTSELKDVPIKGQPVLKRRRRKQVENSVDLDVYMARHPLFSRYDKKKKRDKEETYVEARSDSRQHLHSQYSELEMRVPEESDTEEQYAVVRSTVGGHDSMEQILWKIEALQARVEKMKHQLSRGLPLKIVTQPVPAPKVPANLPRAPTQASPRTSVPSAATRPPGAVGRPPSGLSPAVSGSVNSANGSSQKPSSAQARRRSSDYDINNMVMPVSVGSKYVEHIKHADISTPHWRLVESIENADQPADGSSSDEDTGDEQFESRHADMEINERQQRYRVPPKKSPDGEGPGIGKGRSFKLGKGKGSGKFSGKSGNNSRTSGPSKSIAAETADSPDSNISPAFTGSVPKGKRRKRLFNAHAFTSNRAQKLTAQVKGSPTSVHSVGTPDESPHAEDVVETKPVEESSRDIISSGVMESPNVQAMNLADQGEQPRKKRNTGSGLQVLANP
ncbi:hypothetical protein R1flu_005930 [Riccia fluitans]|uniref:Bromo domain-containing protein n=1 Tax=Riccia fluitans TaxID=41844 RepID=A0ABD1YUK1_9MARC